jgi:hypothetical protein
MVLADVAAGVVRVVLAVVFATACLHKLRAPGPFVAVLRAYRILPDRIVAIAASAAILAEGFVAMAIWLPALATAALACAGLLLVGYSAAIAVNLRRGRRHIDCGCGFGSRAQPISPILIARNVILLAGCVALMLARTASPVAEAVPRGGLDLARIALVVAGAGALLLCHRSFETLLANAPALERLAAGRR